jgi:uncharacterized protein YjbI with pentapeptide repeats
VTLPEFKSEPAAIQFSGPTCRYANVQGADLTEAALIGVNVQEADLTGAILDEADMRGAEVTEEQLQMVVSGKNVKREP